MHGALITPDIPGLYKRRRTALNMLWTTLLSVRFNTWYYNQPNFLLVSLHGLEDAGSSSWSKRVFAST
jgi:hypothetical protein